MSRHRVMENGALENTYSVYGDAVNYDYPTPLHGRFVKAQLARICADARKLHALLGNNDRMPAWVMYKIGSATERLNSATEYLRYRAHPEINAYDYAGPGVPDGRMIRQTLQTIERDAAQLQALIKDTDHVAPWVPKFVYTSQDRLGVIAEYIKTAGADFKGYSGPVEDIGADIVKTSKVLLMALGAYALYDTIRERMAKKA